MADPFALAPGFRGPPQPDGNSALFDELTQCWTGPFMMAATRGPACLEWAVKGAVQSFRGGLMAESDKLFAGSIPKFYDTLMVPLIFEAYAADLAELVAASSPGSVLETAAGSGAVRSRRLRQDLSPTRATW